MATWLEADGNGDILGLYDQGLAAVRARRPAADVVPVPVRSGPRAVARSLPSSASPAG
ncbi:hypothetical protein [Actinocatenispora rupis]|uniref:Uncharacterized protein n=1 Tax=Actinocatenispora rupis TaxID=519421 RepID=A0A8J3J9M9_9ACTN|nr:hypothetical protein [Actinocatenispora rupis]GID12672.1 hypothetical protein Aru02nite_35610 [Actinocatenispora rupis]